jgi:hypothetical protein
VKQNYKLTDAEMNGIFNALNEKRPQEATAIWQSACTRLGCSLESVEVNPTGNAADFLAEPLPVPAAVNGDVRQGHTSASNAQADALCPGRHLAQRGIPEPPKGEDASIGTRIHGALAGESGVLPSLSVDERDTFDACRAIEKKLVVQFFGSDDPKFKVQRHERLWVRWENHAHSGEPDVVFRFGTKALILDYKVLSGDVAESSRNEQLRDLAVLVKVNSLMLDEIAVAIVQPLVTHSPELCVYAAADLERSALNLRARVEASNNPKSLRVAGEVQCKWCKAKMACKEFTAWQGKPLASLTVSDDEIELFKSSMGLWTPQQWSLALDLTKRGATFFDLIKGEAKERLDADPSAIPGYRLKPGAVRESITDPQQCFDRFAALGGHLNEFFPCIKVQKGDLKEAVAGVTKKKGKALAAELATLLEGITEEKQSAPSLARSDEK